MRVFGYSSLADYIERCPSDAAVAATLEEFWEREFEIARRIEEEAAAERERIEKWERENPEALRRFNETWDRLIEEGRQRQLRYEEALAAKAEHERLTRKVRSLRWQLFWCRVGRPFRPIKRRLEAFTDWAEGRA